MSLAAVLGHYQASHAAGLPSALQARIAGDLLLRHLPGARIADLTPLALERYIAGRRAERNPPIRDATIARELSVLPAALERARRDRLLSEIPAIPELEAAAPRERVLSRAEAARLLAACRTPRRRHLALFIRLGLYTGARPGAILDLTWDRVDLARRLVDFRLPARKIGRKRRAVAPIDGPLLSALARARQRARSPYVVDWAGDRSGSVKKAFARAAAEAGFIGVSPGTLRHTAASWARAGGANLWAIAALLGHSRVATTERYANYGGDYLRAVTRAIRAGAREAGRFEVGG